jgi:hypothetical protein
MKLDHYWRKSSYSGNAGSANCVEAGSAPDRVLVRDTAQHGNGPVMSVSLSDWRRFTGSLRVEATTR